MLQTVRADMDGYCIHSKADVRRQLNARPSTYGYLIEVDEHMLTRTQVS